MDKTSYSLNYMPDNLTNKSSKNKIIVRNTIFLTVRMLFVLCISLYTSRVLLQVLGVEDFGIYNVIAGFVSMFAFLNTSMTNANQRFYSFELGKSGTDGANRVYNTSLAIQLCLAVIIVVLTETFGLWYLYEKMVIPPDRLNAAFWVFQFSVFSMIFLLFQIPYSACVVAHEKMDFVALAGIIDAILKLLIAITLPYVNADQLIIYGSLILLTSVVHWGLYFFYGRKHFVELKFHRGIHKDLFKNMLSFSAWNFFGSFAFVMREQGVNMVLNLFFGPIVNAARGIAYQVSGAIKGLVHNITSASRPQMVQSYAEGNVDRTINIMFSISKLVYLAMLCIALPVMLEVDYVLKIWLGDLVPQHTGNFIILVIVASLIKTFHPMTSHIVHATGKIKSFQIVNGVIDLSVVPIAYLFCKLGYSPESVFTLYIIINIVIQIICWNILQSLVDKFSTMQYIWKVIFPLCIITLLSLLLPLYAHLNMESSFIRLCVVTVLSVLSTVVFTFYVGLNKTERNVVVSYILKLHKK